VVLELCAALLVLAQPALTWISSEYMPATVLPFYGPGQGASGLAITATEAGLWTWLVIGLWSMLLGISLVFYRAVSSTFIPILSVSGMAFLAVLRAGVISLNLTPDLSPARVLLRAVTSAIAVLILAALLERWRSRKLLVPALMRPALYDEPAPLGIYFAVICLLTSGLSWIFVPSRVKVMDRGLVAITPVSYLWLPAAAIERAEAATRLQAVLGGGINLATTPTSSIRLILRRRWFPVVVSVADRDRFLQVIRDLTGDT
jgi:hypothetical protein